MNHNPFDCENVDKNHIEHDKIFILGTINYVDRYRLLNGIDDVVDQKIAQMKKLRTAGHAHISPAIHIYIATGDEQEYPKQSERFFSILNRARVNGLAIETNVIEPICLNSWAGRIVREFATPGFRNMYEAAYHYYYPQTYDIVTKKVVISKNKIIIPPEKLLQTGLCDTIFMENGRIRTR